MSNTLPNIVIQAGEVVDIYAETGVTVGTQIATKMIGNGEGKLFAGAALPAPPTNATGYTPIYAREEMLNDAGDAGAFIYSEFGCTINVSVV